MGTTKVIIEQDAAKRITSSTENISLVYCCYNGMMLGNFMAGAFLQQAKEQYAFVRERIIEVLKEIKVDCALPAKRNEFIKDHNSISINLARALQTKSTSMLNYYLLGSLTWYFFINCKNKNSEFKESRKATYEHLDSMKLNRKLLDYCVQYVKRESKETGFKGDLVNSAALKFLNYVLSELPSEKKLSFVAMPFKPPYLERYGLLYKPVLKESKSNIIRAWGGLGDEEYQNLLLTLISKCGVFLADISELNRNVIFEIGYAMGKDAIQVYLVYQKTEENHTMFSNISNLAIFMYDTTTDNWPKEDILRIKSQIALLSFGASVEDKSFKTFMAGKGNLTVKKFLGIK